nr:MHYT domain-containing protein [Cytobacillus firmus]
MTEIIVSINPVLIFVAVILTIMASYTALDLFTLIKSSDKNQKFLFLGGTFSLGIGIWIMNFIGMVAININASGSYNIPLTLLSMVLAFHLPVWHLIQLSTGS